MNKNKMKDKGGLPSDSEEFEPGQGIRRRTLLKALAGIPVLGVFALGLLNKTNYDRNKKGMLLKTLELDGIQIPEIPEMKNKAKVLRIGIIGFGNEGTRLARCLGFIHPEDLEGRRKSGRVEDWMAQEDLNVALTGICDVFDLHAKKGLETAGNDLRPGGGKATGHPIKRYQSYHEMLVDKDIDAVIIATPDHHHAPANMCTSRNVQV